MTEEVVYDWQARIEAEEKRWAEVAQQLQRQYEMEHAAYTGRISVYKELLAAANGHGATERDP